MSFSYPEAGKGFCLERTFWNPYSKPATCFLKSSAGTNRIRCIGNAIINKDLTNYYVGERRLIIGMVGTTSGKGRSAGLEDQFLQGQIRLVEQKYVELWVNAHLFLFIIKMNLQTHLKIHFHRENVLTFVFVSAII